MILSNCRRSAANVRRDPANASFSDLEFLLDPLVLVQVIFVDPDPTAKLFDLAKHLIYDLG